MSISNSISGNHNENIVRMAASAAEGEMLSLYCRQMVALMGEVEVGRVVVRIVFRGWPSKCPFCFDQLGMRGGSEFAVRLKLG
jgi:hypothetical protein